MIEKKLDELEKLITVENVDKNPEQSLTAMKALNLIVELRSLIQTLDLHTVMYPRFWVMSDMHTFEKIEGNNLLEIKKKAKDICKKYPYGLLCPVIIMNGNNEVRRVGICAHIDGTGKADIDGWYKSIKDDPVVQNFSHK